MTEWSTLEVVVACVTAVYSALLILPSTPLLPPTSKLTRPFLRLILFLTVIAPMLLAASVVAGLTPLSPILLVATSPDASAAHQDQVGGGKGYLSYAPFWSPALHGPSGNHDFCEENYRFSSGIAEFHNTWSSAPIIFYGAVGPYYIRKHATPETRFSLAFIAIGGIGIGSSLFHGTLLRFGQVLDEVPMLVVIFVGFFIFIEDQRHRQYGAWLPTLLFSSCAIFIIAYLVLYLYWMFCLAFAGGLIMLLVRGAVVLRRDATRLNFVCFMMSAMSLLTGSLCWLLDDMFCHHLRFLRLHIGWHVLAAGGGYLFVMFLVSLRAKAWNSNFAVRLPGIHPGQWVRGQGWRLVQDKVSIHAEACDAPEFFLPYVEFRPHTPLSLIHI